MIFGQWEVKIQENIARLDYAVYMFRRTNSGIEFMLENATIKTVNEGEFITDKELVFAYMSSEQLQALANGLAAQGIKNQNDHKNEGLLLAKEAHLEDMRALVFKTKPVSNRG